jgi:SAM-dependent methyltransferase
MTPIRPKRSPYRKLIDCVAFPLRALVLIEKDRWGLSSLATDRFYYVSEEVAGYCLDVGCGKHNRFVTEFLCGNGKGIDVYPYEGLTDEHLVQDITSFPFESQTFETVSFISNINHVPRQLRDIELAEAYRCLKTNGNIIVTMGNPVAEILTHKVVWFYDRLFGTHFDMDNERGMHSDEEYYLLNSEIRTRLIRAGFINIRKRYFFTEWCLNHMFIAWKA